MRVAIVTEAYLPRVNGVSNSVVQVARELGRRGVAHMVIAPGSPGDGDPDDVSVSRVRSIELPGIHDVDVAMTRSTSLVPVLRAFAPSVVHLASPFILGSRGLAAARTLGVPSVAVFQTDVAGFARHYGLARLSFLADSIVRRVHRDATMTLAPSRASQQYLTDLGIPDVRRWGRGVDLDRFTPAARTRELHQHLGGGRPLVGYVGRLAPEKRINSLRILADRADVQLVIIGDGPSRADLERLLPEAHFTGRLDGADLVSHVACLDVLVAPGEQETFCQVVQEAMACQVPVVAPAVGGPVDLIEHGRTGLLYRPGDDGDMRACVERLLADPALARAIGAAGGRWVATRDWQALTDELIEHYRDAMTTSQQVLAA
jgi:phosphatidylinositol alpha 1,6-mannosyltransferase